MKKIIYLLLACALLLMACSKDDEQAGEHGEKDAERGEKNGAAEVQGENMYPLTGLYTDDPVDNRIIGVMVNNHPEARPQSGLVDADIVFEILAESNITRFLALFQSEIPEVIGPVRSAREYYFELANNYDALYVYHGAAGFIDDMIVNQGIPFLNGAVYDNDGYLFKRESFRKAPHNSYLQGDAIYEVAEDKGYTTAAEYEALPFLEEAEIEAIDGEAAEHVEIVYSNQPMWVVEYDYDEETGKYKRSSDGEPSVDLDSEEAITADNVFIVETHHEVIDNQGRRSVDIESGGNAYLLQKGKVQQVEWANENGKIIPVKDGQAIGFVPGNTWINVVPTSPSMEQSVTISNH